MLFNKPNKKNKTIINSLNKKEYNLKINNIILINLNLSNS